MANDKKTPGDDQDTSGLFFGKYKTQKEAEEAFKEMERKFGEVSEARDRLEKVISVLEPVEAAAPSSRRKTREPEPEAEEEGEDLFSQAEEYFDEGQRKFLGQLVRSVENKTATRVLKTVGTAIGEWDKTRNQMTTFYGKHKDLVGYEDFVQLEAQKLKEETRGRKLDDAEAMKLVADRVKKRIEAIRKGNRAPLHLESGESDVNFSRGDEGGDEDEDARPDPQADLMEFIEERRSMKNKKSVVKGRE